MREYNLRVVRVSNGWLVMDQPRHIGMQYDMDASFVVKDGENLAEAIAAVLVAQKLEGRDTMPPPAQDAQLSYAAKAVAAQVRQPAPAEGLIAKAAS